MAVRPIRAALSMMVLACAAGAASATVTEYTDPTAYGAATSNTTIFNFDGLAAPDNVSPGGVDFGDLSVNGSSSNLPLVIGSGSPFYGGQSFFTSLSPDPQVAAEVLCTLSGSTAIGFVYGDFVDEGALPFTVTLSTGESFTLNTPANPGLDTGFVGFVSDAPITSVTFSSGGQVFDLLEVERSSGSPVGAPEPGTWALMAAGLLALAVRARPRTVTGFARRTSAR